MFEVKQCLLGQGTLAPGNYEFPIAFQLAANLPGSFECAGSHNGRAAS